MTTVRRKRVGVSPPPRSGGPRAGSGSFLRSMHLASGAPTAGFPFEMSAVANLGTLSFGDVTIFVGDNGTGKSTLVEALAVAAGFNAEGGGRNLRFETMATHSELNKHLALTWNVRPNWGWFLRAETFYGMATHIATEDDDPDYKLSALFPDLHGRSHGQSFLELIASKFTSPGLYIMDEPESALSFNGQRRLMETIRDGTGAGSQFVIATHSPLLMSVPGATIYELDDRGPIHTAYAEVAAVKLWKQFFADGP
jgi:predicted ATPase